MTPENQELLQQLSRLAMSLLEDTTVVTLQGQSRACDAECSQRLSQELAETAHILASIATIVHFLADSDGKTSSA